jgi:hypothetical protein
MTMTQPQFFRRKRLAAISSNGNHGRLGWTDDAQRFPTDLDVAGRKIRVAHLRWPGNDLTSDEHDTLRPETAREVDRFGRCERGIKRDLNDASAITKVDEDEATQIAAAMHPSTESYRCTNVLQPQRTAKRVAECSLERRGGTHEPDSRRRRAVW